MTAAPPALTLTRASLVLLWWGTVAASLHDGGAAGQALLEAAGLGAGAALALVLAGCAWDAAVGLWLLLRPGVLAYRVAAAGVVAMTLLATLLAPRLWLDPFGALLKNLPLLALLAALAEEARAR